MGIIDKITNRFKDKSRADYVATQKEMAQHSFDVARKELAKSVEMGLRFKRDYEAGNATNGQLAALEYQQGLSDFYLKQVDFGKLIYS
jgi:hypothetical protein